jgi:hypothetical protein
MLAIRIIAMLLGLLRRIFMAIIFVVLLSFVISTYLYRLISVKVRVLML